MYQIARDVLYQFDYRIPEDVNIAEFVKKNLNIIEQLSNDIMIVLSKNGQIFELNVTSSIIFKDIVEGVTKTETVKKICNLFIVEKEKVQIDYDFCCNYLLENKILLRM